MRCLKCGEKIPSGQFFCEECGDAMENYPVNPGTPIQLPPRAPKPAPAKKGRAKKALPPEVLVVRQRRSLGLLLLALVMALTAFAATAVLALHLLEEREQSAPPSAYVNVSRETFQS